MDSNVFRSVARNVPGHWTKGAYSDGQNNFCALGHLARALGQENGDWDGLDFRQANPYVELLTETIVEQYAEDYFLVHDVLQQVDMGSDVLIPEWNDAPGRTEDEVVAIFEKAAAKAEEL